MANICRDCARIDLEDSKRIYKSNFDVVGSTGFWCKNLLKYVHPEQEACLGFVKPMNKISGCFLTTACVEYKGLSDDCEELTLLRKFRDEHMKLTETGRVQVEEYYRVAPLIVKAINESVHKEQTYAQIYATVCLCVALIKKCEYEKVYTLYSDMVLELKEKFLK